MTTNVQDKTIAVTGASSGIGEATARLLAKSGARVVLGARRLDRLETIVEDIKADGGQASACVLDVTKRADAAAFVDSAVKTFGRLDVMINNAGVMLVEPMAALNFEDWDRMIDVNVKGVLNGIGAALPVMTAQGSGHIINISSVAGHKVFPGFAVYCGTKSAVRAITDGLRMEAGAQIRNTIISPGGVLTELPTHITGSARSGIDAMYETAISPDAIARAILYAIEQPADVDVNEILIRPTAQEF